MQVLGGVAGELAPDRRWPSPCCRRAVDRRPRPGPRRPDGRRPRVLLRRRQRRRRVAAQARPPGRLHRPGRRRAGVPSVNVDDRGGARAAAQHLLDLGHRRIGAIVSVVGARRSVRWRTPRDLPIGHATHQRMLGWDDALVPAGVHGRLVRADRRYELRRGPPRRPDPARPRGPADRGALLLRPIAAAVVHEARERGLEVPRDLSVVGFDDSPLARRTGPALTTVRQDSSQKGRLAVRALLDAIEALESGAPAPGRGAARTSCRPSWSCATAPVLRPWRGLTDAAAAAGRARAPTSPPRRSAATPGTCCCPRSAGRGSGG